MQRFRRVLTALFAFALVSSLIQGVLFNFGLVLPILAAAAAGLLLCLRWQAAVSVWKNLRARLWGRIFTGTVALAGAAGVLVCLILSGLMIHAILQTPPGGQTTVIVLGARVTGERPSLMLERRLQAAVRYLKANPESVAVLSGGLGAGADISEALAMKRWLAANGIAEERLFLEDRSISTYENMIFSQMVIAENNLPQRVAIATDGFHIYRAHLLARQAGLDPSAIPAQTPIRLLPYYWVREIAAILVGFGLPG